MKIFLIGLPGSGKTTLGKSLAEKLKLSFLDLDTEVEKSEGRPVKGIFETNGENYFREVESNLLGEFCSAAKNFVMSTGGGTPCFNKNMMAMNKAGRTVFLDVGAKEIASRLVKTNLNDRPLLSGLNQGQLAAKIELLRLERISFYKMATFTFEGHDISAENVFQKIIK
jgi:shikimate kinase